MAVRLLCSFICSFVDPSKQVSLPRYLVNGLSNLDEGYSEYSLAYADLIRGWRSKVSRLPTWQRHPYVVDASYICVFAPV